MVRHEVRHHRVHRPGDGSATRDVAGMVVEALGRPPVGIPDGRRDGVDRDVSLGAMSSQGLLRGNSHRV